jgi:hypothetical protein
MLPNDLAYCHVEISVGGVVHSAEVEMVNGLLHLQIAGRGKVVAVPIRGASIQESAARILRKVRLEIGRLPLGYSATTRTPSVETTIFSWFPQLRHW